MRVNFYKFVWTTVKTMKHDVCHTCSENKGDLAVCRTDPDTPAGQGRGPTWQTRPGRGTSGMSCILSL